MLAFLLSLLTVSALLLAPVCVCGVKLNNKKTPERRSHAQRPSRLTFWRNMLKLREKLIVKRVNNHLLLTFNLRMCLQLQNTPGEPDFNLKQTTRSFSTITDTKRKLRRPLIIVYVFFGFPPQTIAQTAVAEFVLKFINYPASGSSTFKRLFVVLII